MSAAAAYLRKDNYFGCLTKGHVLEDCTTILCCENCGRNDNHVTKACPATKSAKITAVPVGFAVEGMGFYYITFLFGKQKVNKNESACAKVRTRSLKVL